MDRNLGATQVANAYNDSNAYGHLFQWGRGDDGSQLRGSSYTTTLYTDDSAGDKWVSNYTDPKDWRDPQKDGLWNNGVNIPIPTGWRLPTSSELDAERTSWSTNNSAGAYGSTLKWTVAGGRSNYLGTLYDVDVYGYYWSSTINGTKANGLFISNSSASIDNGYRAIGFSVRLVKLVAPTVTTQDATNITTTSCTGNGNITGGDGATRRGFCYKVGTSGDPTTADSVAYNDGTYSTGAYTKSITGLTASTGYRVRAYAVNSAGTSYGSTVQVTTLVGFIPQIIMM